MSSGFCASAAVTVQWHPDAAGVDQLDPVGAAAPELDVRVAEDDALFGGSCQHSIVVVAGLGRERLQVGEGRGVAVADAADNRLLRECAQLSDKFRAERGAAVGDRALQQLIVTGLIGKRRPAVHVAPDPDRVAQRPQRRDRLRRPRSEQRVVAAEQKAVNPLTPHVLEDGLERRQIPMHVVEHRERRHVHSNSIEEVQLVGPSNTLRYARSSDAAALRELGADPDVTRFFSWGPYTSVEQPAAYIAGLAAERERGERLDFVIVDSRDRPLGVTGLTELSRRDRRAVVGTWLGRAYWGAGVNREAKALIAHLVFLALGLERLGAYADLENQRSQAALARIGFVREGTLRRWHRHGDRTHDVFTYSWLKDEWQRSPLAAVPVQISGDPPPAFVVVAPRPPA